MPFVFSITVVRNTHAHVEYYMTLQVESAFNI